MKKKMFQSQLHSFLLQLLLLLGSLSSSAAFSSFHTTNRRELVLTHNNNRKGLTVRRRSLISWALRQESSSSSSSSSDGTNDNNKTTKKKKKKPIIAIIGSGAVGCYYGARLYETGLYDLRFLMRGDHYQVSKTEGLTVTSIDGDVIMSPDDIGIYDNVQDMGGDDDVDWVICALKSTSLEAAPSLIQPLLGKHTRVLAIMNGMMDQDLVDMLEGRYNNDDDLSTTKKTNDEITTNESSSSLTCCAAIYAGMALVCSNKIAPGCVNHSYAGKLTGALSASSSADTKNNQEHEEAFLQLWSNTKIPHVWENDLTRGRWSKMCWNLPFNGISVAMGGITVDVIVNDPGLRKLAYQVMDETIAAGNADLQMGKSTTSSNADTIIPLGSIERDAMMHLSDTMGAYRPSTMLDFLARRPMEVKYLFRKALDRAKELKVPVPHLETLVIQIEAYQRIYNLY